MLPKPSSTPLQYTSLGSEAKCVCVFLCVCALFCIDVMSCLCPHFPPKTRVMSDVASPLSLSLSLSHTHTHTHTTTQTHTYTHARVRALKIAEKVQQCRLLCQSDGASGGKQGSFLSQCTAECISKASH